MSSMIIALVYTLRYMRHVRRESKKEQNQLILRISPRQINSLDTGKM